MAQKDIVQELIAAVKTPSILDFFKENFYIDSKHFFEALILDYKEKQHRHPSQHDEKDGENDMILIRKDILIVLQKELQNLLLVRDQFIQQVTEYY